MKDFQVEITQLLQITVSIKAESREKAIQEARSLYDKGQFKIDSSNLIATEFDISPI